MATALLEELAGVVSGCFSVSFRCLAVFSRVVGVPSWSFLHGGHHLGGFNVKKERVLREFLDQGSFLMISATFSTGMAVRVSVLIEP